MARDRKDSALRRTMRRLLRETRAAPGRHRRGVDDHAAALDEMRPGSLSNYVDQIELVAQREAPVLERRLLPRPDARRGRVVVEDVDRAGEGHAPFDPLRDCVRIGTFRSPLQKLPGTFRTLLIDAVSQKCPAL